LQRAQKNRHVTTQVNLALCAIGNKMKQRINFIWLTILLTIPVTVNADICKSSYDVVINKSSKILRIPKNEIVVTKSFSEQIPPGDALDIVEIIMEIEDSLNIEINDKKLDEKIGSKDIKDLPKKLTIKVLQETAEEACKKRITKSSRSPLTKR
jgi:acyl carrier protein